MTDKQIIIDGVDVSGCEFYSPYSEKCGCIVDDNGNNNLFCREYRDCYYKRMYHTGQEKDIYKNENKELYKLLTAKEQECEELKKEAVNLKLNLKKVINLSQKKNRQCYQFLADIKQFKAENKHLNDLLNQALKELEKTRETLTEIKELCKRQDLNQGSRCIHILQKISEVE